MTTPRTLPDLLTQSAGRFPDRIAVVEGDKRLTYSEFRETAHQMASLLHEKGVRRGDRVAVLMPPSIMHAVTFFGITLLGAIPVAFHVRESGPTLVKIAHMIRPQLVVYDLCYRKIAAKLMAEATFISEAIEARSSLSDAVERSAGLSLVPDDLRPAPEDFKLGTVHPQDTAAIVLSSGTTGIPKGIMHSHGSLTGGTAQGAAQMKVTDDSAILNVFTTAFVGWLNMTIPLLANGAKVVYLPAWNAEEYLRLIEAERVSFFIVVPTMWRMLLAAGPENHDLSSLKRVGFAGEPIDPTTLEEIRSRICDQVINTYGTTETGPWGGCTVMTPTDYENGGDLRSIGRAIDGVEVRIITPGGDCDDQLPHGEEGELIISGPSIANRIWERPELEAKAFRDGYWYSGDLAVMDADGFITLSGRVDDMIISGGINIMPGQIEDILQAHPQVRECAVAGVPSPEWGQEVTAFVIADAGLDEETLRAFVQDRDVSKYKQPRRYVFLDAFPRGNTGKVNRKQLKETYARA